MNKVSYIIVTWNNADIIGDCISSILKYSNVDNEIIVVDNNSKDATCSYIENNFKNIVDLVKLKENVGFSKANNIALQKASGEFVFFVNPDVFFTGKIIKKMISILKENNNIGIVSPKLVYPNLKLQKSYGSFPSPLKVIFDDFYLYKLFLNSKSMIKYAQSKCVFSSESTVDWTFGAAQLCRMNEVKKLGGYPEGYFMYGEDTEFCMKMNFILKKNTFYVPQLEAIHIGGYSEKKVFNSKKAVLVAKASMFFVKKYEGILNLIKFRLLMVICSIIKCSYYFVKSIFIKDDTISQKRKKHFQTLKVFLFYRGD